jgi:hypothetical protein
MKLAAAFGVPSVPAIVDRMLRAMRSQPWHASHALSAGAGMLGGVTVADRFSAVPSLYQSPTGNRLLVSGVPIDLTGAVAERLRRSIELPLQAALAELRGLDGVFAAMLWHEGEGKLAVVTDILGVQPLYMHRKGTGLLLATEVKAIGASGLAALVMDPAGWGVFLSFGHTIANQTLLHGVERVDPGSVLVYDAATGALAVERYWDWPMPRHANGMDDLQTGELIDVLWEEMQAYEEHHPNAVIALSGGHDSRLLLALLFKNGRRPTAITVSQPHEWFDFEAKVARRLARLHGIPITVRRVHEFFSSTAYLEYVAAHELASPSLVLSIPRLSAVLDSEMQAIWEGLFLGVSISPSSQPAGGFGPYLERATVSFDHWQWQAAAQVFAPRVLRAMQEAYTESLRAEIARYADDEYGVAEFIVRNRMRHRTGANPAQAFSAKVLAFTPGASRSFWANVAPIPYALRRDHRLYRYLFDTYFPTASKVPAISGPRPYSFGRPFDLDYLLAEIWNTLSRSRGAPVAKRVGLLPADLPGDRSRFVADALAHVDPDHPDLNPDGLRSLKASVGPFGAVPMRARELVFYWDAWRRMMAGTLMSSPAR